MKSAANQNKSRSSSKDQKIAVVGMSCLFPGAPDLASFWENIVEGRDATRDVNKDEWDPEKYYRKDSSDFESIYCKRGGFITELADFDPLKYGVMPNSIPGSDPDQMLALKVASETLLDAGYTLKSFDGSKAEVILGRTSVPGAGSMNTIQRGHTVKQIADVLRKLHPEYSEAKLASIESELKQSLKQTNSDTIPAVMPNVLAGRIAGRLGFQGKSLILDAACASSLVAVELAVNDLLSGVCDVALAGGVHVNSFAVFYQLFCGLGALSKSEVARPFDDRADGTLLGEGIGMVLLKRLEDAERDGNKIYCVIGGIGSSSDGQGTSMIAPSSKGEALAMKRAFEMAGVAPASVQLLEAHGTGTAAGDVAEMEAVRSVYGESAESWMALGSVKSMIGHTQAASGIAGFIKTALALHHKILPPTLYADKPSTAIDWKKSPCYISRSSRVWINSKVHPTVPDDVREALYKSKHEPRRAAVSAFGFGGVNAHAVLEEYEVDDENASPSLLHTWETELCAFAFTDLSDLQTQLKRLSGFIERNSHCKLKDIAYSLNEQFKLGRESKSRRFAMVVESTDELKEVVDSAVELIESAQDPTMSGSRVFIDGNEEVSKGRLAFVLPGLGAAYPNMLEDLLMHFPDVRQIFDFVDELSKENGGLVIPSERVFPRPDKPNETAATLAALESSVVMLIMTEWAIFTLLQKLGIQPDALLGCSTGEFAALTMGGAADILKVAPLFYRLSTKVARNVSPEKQADLRSVLIEADWEDLKAKLANIPDLYLGAALCSTQTLISGSKDAVKKAGTILSQNKITHTLLPMAIPYHTPLVKGIVEHQDDEVKNLPLQIPSIESWSCSRVAPFPSDIEVIRKITTELFTHPIRLTESINAMYAQGITRFVEVGPKGVLTPLISDILSDRPHLSVASNMTFGSALTQLNCAIAELMCNGCNATLDYLFARRAPQLLDFDKTYEKQSKSSIRLPLNYPEIKLSDEQTARINAIEPQAPKAVQEFGDLEDSEGPIESAERDFAPTDYAAQTSFEPAPQQDDGVMKSYLQNITNLHQNFMHMQQNVMSSYLHTSATDALDALDALEDSEELFDFVDEGLISESQFGDGDLSIWGDSSVSAGQVSLPLLQDGHLSYGTDGQSIAIDLPLSLQFHQYLVDHAIGGAVSYTGERVNLVPLTVALETMAEAASILEPGKFITALKSIRAVKRIRVGVSGLPVRVEAKRSVRGNHVIQAEISVAHQACMSCEVHFADAPQPAPNLDVKAQPDARASKLDRNDLYGEKLMFHGPRMQSVVSIDSVSQKQIAGQVVARPAESWFMNDNDPKFVLDPLLLDNSTQLVLYHLFEYNEDVTALLPFLVESIEFFVPLSSLRGITTVTALMRSVSARGTEADVIISLQDGTVAARFNSISSRRIILSDKWKSFVRTPAKSSLSASLNQIVSEFGQEISTTIFAISDLPTDDTTLSWCADYVLSEYERVFFDQIKGLPRKTEWLAGRIAAKDAVRNLLHGNEANRLALPHLCHSDISILSKESGQPYAFCPAFEALGWAPHISISHKAEVAIAVAGRAPVMQSIGIDVEPLKEQEQGFESLAFHDFELKHLGVESGQQVSSPDAQQQVHSARAERMTMLWAAKECVGKALGIGLSNNPKSLKIESVETAQTSNGSSVQHPLAKLVVGMHNVAGESQHSQQIAARSEAQFIVFAYKLGDTILAVTKLDPAYAHSAT